MKSFGLALLLVCSLSSHAQTVSLPDYDYRVGDIGERGLKKELLFQRMNRSLVRSSDSICSNRAHVWAFDFEKQDIKSAKVFLFFTPRTGAFDGLSWWYHVAPVVNEQGKLWVMDAGFPTGQHVIGGPLEIAEWLRKFTGKTSVCKEMSNADEDLLALIFKASAFPERTSHGVFNCYYKLVPPGYWTPSQIALNALGRDEHGVPVRFSRDEFETREVFQACKEASSSMVGWVLRSTERRCRSFIQGGTQNFTSW